MTCAVFPQGRPGCVKAGSKPRRSFLVSVLCIVLFVTVGTNCGSLRRSHHSGSVSGEHMKISATTGARVILRSTVLATAKAPLSSTAAGIRTCGDRSLIFLRDGLFAPARERRQRGTMTPQPGEEAFEQLLDRMGLPARSCGSVEFLVDGASFFSAFYQSVESARQRIDMQIYIFDNDRIGAEVAERLKHKSHQTPVRLLYDPAGSMVASEMNPPAGMESPFGSLGALMSSMTHDSRVHVRTTSNPWLVSDHTKLIVFDDRVAFIGGMNVGAEYRDTWHDMMVRIDGPIVSQMRRLFDDHWKGEEWWRPWRLDGLRDSESGESPASPAVVDARHPPLRMLVTDNTTGRREVLAATLAAIRGAQRRVWIETPYFSVDEITAEVKQALERGVDVRVIIPGDVDSRFMRKVNLVELRKLVRSGARVYDYPGMTHLKATLCDGWATFGSANCDTLSMRINRELNTATSDPATIRQLIQKVFEPDFRASSQLRVEVTRARGGALTELLGDQL